MKKRLALILAFCLIAATGWAQNVKLGILMDFSGPIASLSPAIEAGAQLAVEQANAAGGLFGGEIETVSRDTRANEQVALDAASKLVEVDRVAAVVGALASGASTAATSVTIPNQVVLVSPASTAPTLTTLDDNDYFFRTCPSDALQGKVQGKLAYDQGYRTAGVIYVNNPYGKGLAENFRSAFQAAGDQRDLLPGGRQQAARLRHRAGLRRRIRLRRRHEGGLRGFRASGGIRGRRHGHGPGQPGHAGRGSLRGGLQGLREAHRQAGGRHRAVPQGGL